MVCLVYVEGDRDRHKNLVNPFGPVILKSECSDYDKKHVAHLSKVNQREAIWVRTRNGPVEVEREYITVITDAGRVVTGHRPIDGRGDGQEDHAGSDGGVDPRRSTE